MKFNCGLTKSERLANRVRKYENVWLPYFAWFPVRVGPHDCRWLEYIERYVGRVNRFSGRLYEIEYRLPRYYLERVAEKGYVEKKNVKNGKRGRPTVEYVVTRKGQGLLNQAKNWF